MNILALSDLQIGFLCIIVPLALLLIYMIFSGPSVIGKHHDFIEKVRQKFPGCKITNDDSFDEVRILYKSQPLIVTKGPDGSIQSEPYEPDANEALAP